MKQIYMHFQTLDLHLQELKYATTRIALNSEILLNPLNFDKIWSLSNLLRRSPTLFRHCVEYNKSQLSNYQWVSTCLSMFRYIHIAITITPESKIKNRIFWKILKLWLDRIAYCKTSQFTHSNDGVFKNNLRGNTQKTVWFGIELKKAYRFDFFTFFLYRYGSPETSLPPPQKKSGCSK